MMQMEMKMRLLDRKRPLLLEIMVKERPDDDMRNREVIIEAINFARAGGEAQVLLWMNSSPHTHEADLASLRKFCDSLCQALKIQGEELDYTLTQNPAHNFLTFTSR